jgi:molecular chaperone GrpE
MQRVNEWDDEEIEVKTVLDGMKLTANKLMAILVEEGFERVDALGKRFDPNFHEALLIQEVDDQEKDNLVDEVLVEGYLFKGILLRPARVKVLKFKGEDEGKGEKEIRDEAEDVIDGDDGEDKYGEGEGAGGDNVDS